MKKLIFFLPILGLLVFSGCKPDQALIQFKHTNNTVYVRLQGEPDKLNPLVTTNGYSRIVYERFFQSPLTFDPKTLEMVPLLAKSRPEIKAITQGPYAGGLSYTFELIPNAKWDNGQSVTAEDVVFTFKAIFNPKTNAEAYRSYFGSIKDIVIDPGNALKYTVYTNEKYFLAEAAIGSMYIMPAYLYDPKGLLRNIPITQLADPVQAMALADSNPALQQFADAFNGANFGNRKGYIAGSGPYQFDGWETGQRIRVTRKSNWWGDALAGNNDAFVALPDTIDFLIIPDPAAANSAVLDQTIDVGTQLDSRDFKALQANPMVSERFNFHTPSVFQVLFISINTKDPMLSDKRTRRALAHLQDIDTAIRDLYEGFGTRVIGPFHPSRPYYHKDLPLIDFNVRKAKQLLKEAGWEDTNANGTLDKDINGERKELELELLVTSSSKFSNDMALLYQETAKQAGVKINISSKAFPVIMAENLSTRKYQLYAGGFAADPTPDDPKQLWHTSSNTPSGTNRTGFGNAQTDALIDQIRTVLDENERNKLYRQLQEIIYDEQPMIFMFAPQDRMIISKRFTAEPTLLKPGYIPEAFKLNTDIIDQ